MTGRGSVSEQTSFSERDSDADLAERHAAAVASATARPMGLVERMDSANYQPRPPAMTERQDSAQNLQVRAPLSLNQNLSPHVYSVLSRLNGSWPKSICPSVRRSTTPRCTYHVCQQGDMCRRYICCLCFASMSCIQMHMYLPAPSLNLQRSTNKNGVHSKAATAAKNAVSTGRYIDKARLPWRVKSRLPSQSGHMGMSRRQWRRRWQS